MTALLLLGLGWLVAGLWVARWPFHAPPPRYPRTAIVIPRRIGPAVLTDAEVVDFFLRVDWKLRCDQPQPVGRDW